jgi:hypothetical protein
MLRSGSKASWIGLRCAPGLWELAFADGRILHVSWRRKSRGVWWSDESRLAGDWLTDLPALEFFSTAAFEQARQDLSDAAWRQKTAEKYRRQMDKLKAGVEPGKPEKLRELGQRANALRGQVLREGSDWVIPSWDQQEFERVIQPSIGSVSALVEWLFNQARRAERRAQATGERVLLLQQKIDDLPSSSAPMFKPDESQQARSKRTLDEPGIKRFELNEATSIWVGQSAEANHRLTFKKARGGDLWLHVRDAPGSHVLLPLEKNKDAAPDHVMVAAALALHYSQLRGERSDVRVAFRRDLEAVKGQPGQVLVRREQVKVLDPRSEEVQTALARYGIKLQMPS